MVYKLNKKKYKMHFSNIFDFFLRKFRIFKKYKYKLRPKRFEKISKSIVKGRRFIHQGRVWVKLRLSKYHVGYTFGEFACTKKPFIFRPKKKKNKRDSRR